MLAPLRKQEQNIHICFMKIQVKQTNDRKGEENLQFFLKTKLCSLSLEQNKMHPSRPLWPASTMRFQMKSQVIV